MTHTYIHKAQWIKENIFACKLVALQNKDAIDIVTVGIWL